jgi:hypothetical protein
MAGMTVAFDVDGRAETVDRLRLIVILPERDMEDLRPNVSLASKDEVTGLYRACE